MNSESEQKHVPFRLAITGGIGCGKSEVGRILKGNGIPVCDTDELARDVTAPGSAVLLCLVEHFGPDILDAEGTLRREVLADRVFHDEKERRFLNAVMHPAINRLVNDWLSRTCPRNPLVAVMIPLLFETGAEEEWDAVLCVSAPEVVVRERLALRGYTPGQTTARLQAQLPLSTKEAASDYVIMNDGTFEELEKKTKDVLKAIQKENMRYA